MARRSKATKAQLAACNVVVPDPRALVLTAMQRAHVGHQRMPRSLHVARVFGLSQVQALKACREYGISPDEEVGDGSP